VRGKDAITAGTKIDFAAGTVDEIADDAIYENSAITQP
jgi:hypothetical protein